MAGIKINARDTILEIQTGPSAWAEVEGLTSITYNPSENEETVDTTTYQSGGEYEGEVMQRGATAECEGFVIKDDATGVQATGQAACELLATKVGPESLGQIRLRHYLDEEWKVWNAYASVGEQGGENNDKTSWSCAFTRSGASTAVDVTP